MMEHTCYVVLPGSVYKRKNPLKRTIKPGEACRGGQRELNAKTPLWPNIRANPPTTGAGT